MNERLIALRRELKDVGVDYYVVPTADAHGSDFTGSAGVAIVSQQEALLFTDSRYYIQAEKQLPQAWTLMKVGTDGIKNWNLWLLEVPAGKVVGLDPALIDFATYEKLFADLTRNRVNVKLLSSNLVDEIWTDQPSRSVSSIRLHPIEFAGKDASDKLLTLRSWLVDGRKSGATQLTVDEKQREPAFLLSALTNIAWLLNLRGSDIKYSPFFYSYLLVPSSEQESFILWIQTRAITCELEQEIERLGGVLKEYDNVFNDLKNCRAEFEIVCDKSVSVALVQAAAGDNLQDQRENVKFVENSPVVAAQAIKNDTEIRGFKNAYQRDGVAWIRWAGWLEERIQKGDKVSEWEAAEQLTKYREQGQHFAGVRTWVSSSTSKTDVGVLQLAYENISATGGNAALPHYAPTRHSTSIINTSTPYLNDSGAQYLDGTIDTTRTVHFGRPTKEQKRAFTRVLQGHIAIDTCTFPKGTTGNVLDVLARKALWADGMNYGHGTGHGVGQYLSVHEGPQGISSSVSQAAFPFEPGHILSNEPAFYKPNSFGIRTESVILVKQVDTLCSFGDQPWFGFERITCVPIQTKMVEWTLLGRQEKEWLREHNDKCKRVLLPLIKGDKRAIKYLSKQ
ncbi:hypothetical protein OIO90_001639 [Microbotryomycetes sp. JL221]|nr:hypothetical protein OIO90_001639 [Microbotryomycetes sp. JL221]